MAKLKETLIGFPPLINYGTANTNYSDGVSE